MQRSKTPVWLIAFLMLLGTTFSGCAAGNGLLGVVSWDGPPSGQNEPEIEFETVTDESDDAN